MNWIKLSRLRLETRFCETEGKTFRFLHEPLFSFRRSRSAELYLGNTGVVHTVNSLRDGCSRNRGSVTNLGKECLSSPKRQDRLRDLHTLLFRVYQGLLPGVKATKAWSCHASHIVQSLRMSGVIRQFPLCPHGLHRDNFNPLIAELNPICHMLTLGARPILHVSRLRVNSRFTSKQIPNLTRSLTATTSC